MASLVCDKLFSMITDKINSIVDKDKDNFCSDPKNTILNKINGSIVTRSAYFLVPSPVKAALTKSLDEMKANPEFVKVCSEADNNKVKEGINTILQNIKSKMPGCKSTNSMASPNAGNSMPSPNAANSMPSPNVTPATGGKHKIKRKTIRKAKPKAKRKTTRKFR